jgi:hypothetical protein
MGQPGFNGTKVYNIFIHSLFNKSFSINYSKLFLLLN